MSLQCNVINLINSNCVNINPITFYLKGNKNIYINFKGDWNSQVNEGQKITINHNDENIFFVGENIPSVKVISHKKKILIGYIIIGFLFLLTVLELSFFVWLKSKKDDNQFPRPPVYSLSN